jgi:hypothetical protein
MITELQAFEFIGPPAPITKMTPNEIQAAIIKAGTNQKAIAEYLGINVHMVWRVVNGMGRSARANQNHWP